MNKDLQKGFTLIELLVVIAIIGILAGLIVVSLSGADDAARDSRIKSNMDQLRSVAEIHKLQNDNSYVGLESSNAEEDKIAADISTQGGENYDIDETANAYCAVVTLNDSSFWCIDSTGFAGPIAADYCEATNYDCANP